MVEFTVSNKDWSPNSDGSGVYYKKSYNGKKVFIKLMEFDGSAMAEALISTLMGYITNLPKEGFMDYSLCRVKGEGHDTSDVGVFCDFIDAPIKIVSLHDFLIGKSKSFRGWEEDYDDFGEFLVDTPGYDLKFSKEIFQTVCKLVAEATKEDVTYVSNYFHKQASIDAIVYNGDRSYDNCALLYDESNDLYKLSPYFDFGNSLFLQEGYNFPKDDIGGPFHRDLKSQVAITSNGFNNKLLQIRYDGFLRDWGSFVEEEYDLNGFFQKDFQLLCSRLEGTKGSLWKPA